MDEFIRKVSDLYQPRKLSQKIIDFVAFPKLVYMQEQHRKGAAGVDGA